MENNKREMINFWMNQKDRDMIDLICKQMDVSRSQFIRLLVLREAKKIYEEIGKPASSSFKTYEGEIKN